MKITLDANQFADAFLSSSRKDSFCRDALEALFEHLEEYDAECEEETELDIIAIDCDYVQYDSATKAARDKIPGFDLEDCPYCGEELNSEGLETCPECKEDLTDDIEEKALKELNDNTTVIEYDGGVVVQSF